MRSVLIVVIAVMLTAALSGCALMDEAMTGARTGPEPQTAAVPPPVPLKSARPAVPEQARPARLSPKVLVGLDQAGTLALLGRPGGMRDEPPATVWSYRLNDCLLEVFFYRDVKSRALHVLTYDVRQRGVAAGEADPDLCVGRIQAENRGPQP